MALLMGVLWGKSWGRRKKDTEQPTNMPSVESIQKARKILDAQPVPKDIGFTEVLTDQEAGVRAEGDFTDSLRAAFVQSLNDSGMKEWKFAKTLDVQLKQVTGWKKGTVKMGLHALLRIAPKLGWTVTVTDKAGQVIAEGP